MQQVGAVEAKARSTEGGFAPVQNTTVDEFTVWGTINGEAFRRTFPSARAWRAWRNLQRTEIEVRGMQSGEWL
ncbi:hypothetical protein EEDFHM_04088 [Methylorubrum populi]